MSVDRICGASVVMQGVANWLKRLGLGQYAQRFAENDIDLTILSDLGDQDLKEIGVSSLGHRRLLLQAIAELKVPGKGPCETVPVTPPLQDPSERRQVTVMSSDLIGSGEAQQRSIVGETPNLARLQALAEPDTVIIADGPRRLLGNLFELEDLGPRDLKGIAGPAGAWGALQPSSEASRLDALHTTDQAAHNPLWQRPSAQRGSTKCTSTMPPKILRRPKPGLPDVSQLDAEQLRIDGALAHIQDRGNLDDHPGDPSERRALIITAVRRGLVAWDRATQRYKLTGSGKGQLAGLSLKAMSSAASATVPASAASAEDRSSLVDRSEQHQPTMIAADHGRRHPAISIAAVVALAACGGIAAAAYLGPSGMLSVGFPTSLVSPSSPLAPSTPSSAPPASVPPVRSSAQQTNAAALGAGGETTAIATGSAGLNPTMPPGTTANASLGDTPAAAAPSQRTAAFGAADVQSGTSDPASPLQPRPTTGDEAVYAPTMAQTLERAAPAQKPKFSRRHHHGNRYGRYRGSRFANENHPDDPRENWSWGSQVGYGYSGR